jgi:hypothetical protein
MIDAKIVKNSLFKQRIPIKIDIKKELESIESDIIKRTELGFDYYYWHIKSSDIFIPHNQIFEILDILLLNNYKIEYYNGLTMKCYVIRW